MFAQITLLTPPYSTLTYSLPECFTRDFWRRGMRVAVPLHGKASYRPGYIESIQETSNLPKKIVCKEIGWPLEISPLLNDEMVDLAKDLAIRQAIPAGLIYGYVLPAGLRSATTKISTPVSNEISDLAQIIKMTRQQKHCLAEDLINGKAKFVTKKTDSVELYNLAVDPPWPVRPNSVKQIQILDYLYNNGAVYKQDLLKTIPGASAVLKTLVAAGYVTIINDNEDKSEKQIYSPLRSFELNTEQKAAAEALENSLTNGHAACQLLYGVTGSGKTAVYMELCKKCLELGRSALLLAPEVALAHKLRGDVGSSFPDIPIFFYHGYQRPAARERTFRELAHNKKPCIVIGARSALFLPLYKPGCVILDEEHDGSYKQDEVFPYHAKEVAWFRANRNNGLLLFGSATPDIRIFHAAITGHMPMLRLQKRVSGNRLPKARLVDISSQSGKPSPGSIASADDPGGILAKETEDALCACIANKEQAIILLNRRGYAPTIFCVDCLKTLRCPNCQISFTYHKGLQRLVCHYCNYSIPFPSPCPDCGKMNFLPIGEGTERLEERLEAIAGRPILRLDRDSARRQGRLEEILTSFAKQESPFLVGTQMLSKGHHFPNVTLVVVADGDIGLNLPDYRATERSFQLLTQAAGRAGRGEKPGQVIIQTRNPGHYCWSYILNNDYENFYADELARRKKNIYPPFINLALLRVSFSQQDAQGLEALSILGKALKIKAKELGLRLLGPAPAPIAMLRGRRRYNCLIKARQWQPVRELYYYALNLKNIKPLHLFLDLDPVDML